MYFVSSNVTAKNNIITNNGTAGAPNVVYFAGTGTQDFSYNNFWGNLSTTDTGGIVLGVGNKFEDPLYVDTIDFVLGAGSPSIDAGDLDPQFNDADGTRNDMGIHGGVFRPIILPDPNELPTLSSDVSNQTVSVNIIPFKNIFNPAHGENADIKFIVLQRSHIVITLYDQLNRVVKQLTNREFPTGTFTEPWDGRDRAGNLVTSGVYRIVIKIGNNIIKYALIVPK